MTFDKLKEPIKCKAKIRYRSKEADAIVYPEQDKVKVIFMDKQRAITTGQSVVFYDEDGIVLGGGKIFKKNLYNKANCGIINKAIIRKVE